MKRLDCLPVSQPTSLATRVAVRSVHVNRVYPKAGMTPLLKLALGGVAFEEVLKGGCGIFPVGYFQNLAYSGEFLQVACPLFIITCFILISATPVRPPVSKHHCAPFTGHAEVIRHPVCHPHNFTKP